MYVSLATLHNALRLVDELADAGGPADLGRKALPALHQLVGADMLSYNELGPAPGQVFYCAYPEDLVFSPASLAAFAAHAYQNPLVSYYRATGDGSPVKISDFVSRERFHRLALYAEFYRHLPVEHQLAVSLPGPAGRVTGIAFSRSSGDFTEDDRDLLTVLRRPLVTAMARARASHRARQALTGPVGSGLTDRERQLLELVASGRTNTAIAHTLEISPRTVGKHLEHIYRKLHVSSRAAAVYRSTAEAMTSPPANTLREDTSAPG